MMFYETITAQSQHFGFVVRFKKIVVGDGTHSMDHDPGAVASTRSAPPSARLATTSSTYKQERGNNRVKKGCHSTESC